MISLLVSSLNCLVFNRLLNKYVKYPLMGNFLIVQELERL
ncbi:protein of unknown function [Moritella yayanosii]|uniref:Uncharacterized protein n=1 Tax=Moritella yayanosii TaxID=69539 RepID=A0A330LPJ3_9GAMM|nr:protein of unknown function [Moritella yayanosii]